MILVKPYLTLLPNLIDAPDLPIVVLDLPTIVYTCDLSKTLLNLTI